MQWSFGHNRKIAAALIVPVALLGALATGGALLGTIATSGVAHALGCENPDDCNPDAPGGLGLPGPPAQPGDSGNPVVIPGDGNIIDVYPAVSASNTLTGGAVAQSCPNTCFFGNKVGFVGAGGTLTFNNVYAGTAGTYHLTLVYCDGSATGRQARITVDGSSRMLSFKPTGSWITIGEMTMTVGLIAGNNTIKFDNPAAYAPDFNEIQVSG